jgi:putative spermidine/putrescine transport system ATP-binding protein
VSKLASTPLPASPVVDGDVNILPTLHIYLRLGANLVSVRRDQLVGEQHAGGRMDIYIRPEHIGFAPLNPASVLTGTVVKHVLQTDHVDTYVDVDIAVEGSHRVLVRSVGRDAIEQFPVGSVTALTLPPEEITVFPQATI